MLICVPVLSFNKQCTHLYMHLPPFKLSLCSAALTSGNLLFGCPALRSHRVHMLWWRPNVHCQYCHPTVIMRRFKMYDKWHLWRKTSGELSNFISYWVFSCLLFDLWQCSMCKESFSLSTSPGQLDHSTILCEIVSGVLWVFAENIKINHQDQNKIILIHR